MPDQRSRPRPLVDHNAVEDMPPAAKLIYLCLQEHQPLAQHEVADATGIPTRTVHESLKRLLDAGVVEQRVNFSDARERLYELASAADAQDSREGEHA